MSKTCIHATVSGRLYYADIEEYAGINGRRGPDAQDVEVLEKWLAQAVRQKIAEQRNFRARITSAMQAVDECDLTLNQKEEIHEILLRTWDRNYQFAVVPVTCDRRNYTIAPLLGWRLVEKR
jgi:hypothetical protein